MKESRCLWACNLVVAITLIGVYSLAQARELPENARDGISGTQSLTTRQRAVLDSPVSQLYTIRAQVMEGANLARSFMSAVARAYAAYGFPGLADNQLNILTESGNYVDAIISRNGRIDIGYGNFADAAIAGKTLSLTPYLSPSSNIVWRCGNNPAPPNLSLPLGTQYQASTVDAAYYKATCATIESWPDNQPDRSDILRHHVAQGIWSAREAQRIVGHNKQSLDILAAAARAYNSRMIGGVNVSSIQIDPATGVITITYGGVYNDLIKGATIVLSPFIGISGVGSWPLSEEISDGIVDGVLEWACVSTTSDYATSQGYIPVVFGTLSARFAPEECQ